MRIRLLFFILVLMFLTALVFVSVHPSSPLRPFWNQVAFSLGNGNSNIRLWGQVDVSEPTNFPEEVKVTVKGVSLHPDLANGAHHACINSIQADTLSFQVSYLQVFGREKWPIQDNKSEPICISFVADADYSSYQYFPIGWEINISNGAPQNAAYFKYPYDEITITVDFTFSGYLYDSNGQAIDDFVMLASQTVGVNAPGWETYEISVPGEALGTGIVLKRPLLLRVLTPILIAILFFVTLCIPFIGTFSTAMEVTVALVFGLWGIRQVVLPAASPGFTGVDIILVGEYGAVVIALLTYPTSNIVKSLAVFRPYKKTVSPTQNAEPTVQYVGLSNSKAYHLPNCPVISRSPDDRLVRYKDRQHAESSGKHLCRLCRIRENNVS